MEFKQLITDIKRELNEAMTETGSASDYATDAHSAAMDARDRADAAQSAIDRAYDFLKEIEEYNILQMSNTQIAEELAARLDRLPAAEDEATNTVIRSVKLSLNAIIQLLKQFKLG